MRLLAHAVTVVLGVPANAQLGNAACWQEGFTYDDCCVAKYGPAGNEQCWDGVHTYANCCISSADTNDFDVLMERGRRGDASVLPRLMQMMASGGGCDEAAQASPVPGLRCLGTPQGLNAKEWREFFSAHSSSKFVRLEKWPPEADPWILYERCCTGEDAEAVLNAMIGDCVFGVVTLLLHVLPTIERREGVDESHRRYATVVKLLEANQEHVQTDCHWQQQVNQAAFQSYAWFLAADGSRHFPCGADVKIFIDEQPSLQPLHAHPLGCANRGLCFTEVWLHQFLRHAACRVASLEEADFVYVPIYASCYGLDKPDNLDHEKALASLYATHGSLSMDGYRKQPPLLILFTCEKWKLKNWNAQLREHAVVAAVEARPLLTSSVDFDAANHYTEYCRDCFGERDFVIPSAVPSVDAARLRYYIRKPEQRELLLVWRGEHAKSKSRDDVAEGYREVNETVRLAIIDALSNKPKVSIGGPSLRYSFLMGNTHFCLVPKGRGWWTVRLFETFYSGCIPVLLSDDQVLPFADELDWESFSIKWPMQRVDAGLYEHLQALVRDDWEAVLQLHANLRKVACWFDYHNVEGSDCSPYLGLLRQLERRKSIRQSPSGSSLDKILPIRRFWF